MVKETYDFEVFYDGDCPLCRREIDWLRRKDLDRRLQFTNIAAPEFDPADVGRTHDQLMARIHGRKPDGSIVEGVEVFRQLYGVLGHHRLVGMTRLPGIRHFLDVAYRVFAKFRTKLPGRHCSNGSCKVESNR